MLKKISRARLDALRQGWLESRRHLPTARFGPLTALDDSLIRPHTGFNTHPDKNEVLLYYIANGELTHGDSLNNHSVLRRGEAPPHQLGRQAVAGHRHQHIVLQVEQGHRIARQYLADRRHQALELHLAGHGGGEIDGDLPQGTIDGFLKTHGTPRKTPRGERISIAAPDWQVFDPCDTVFIYS